MPRRGRADSTSDRLHDEIRRLVGHHARKSVARQILREIDRARRDHEDRRHQPPRYVHLIFAGQAGIERDRGSEKGGECDDHRHARLREERYDGFDHIVGHSEKISEGQPARSDARAVIDGDHQEGCRKKSCDSEIDCDDETCGAHDTLLPGRE
jgi:hypothetical protein